MENSTDDFLGNTSFIIQSFNASVYERNAVKFWMMFTISSILALLSIIGNGLVLYTSFGDLNAGPLGHLDTVIKSLAMADMLYGLVGVPCKIFGDYHVGECINVYNLCCKNCVLILFNNFRKCK